MSDIEQLRQDVINAARECVSEWRTSAKEAGDGRLQDHVSIEEYTLSLRLNRLDAAERTDLWKLLDMCAAYVPVDEKPHAMYKAALKWREEHPND